MGGKASAVMTMALPTIMTSRIEKAAVDNGFDRELPREGEWLSFASTQCPLRIWIGASNDSQLVTAFSKANVASALNEYGTAVAMSLPQGARSACAIADVPTLHRVLRRAFQLGRTLPDELLHLFEAETGVLPRRTEAERLIVQRVGQDVFRRGLLDFWDGRCAITGLAVPELLRASHVKPWAVCECDAERLDVFNGLLLAPNLDALFDSGLMTIAEDGVAIVSVVLDAASRQLLGIDVPLKVRVLHEEHRQYLNWHRQYFFRDSVTSSL